MQTDHGETERKHLNIPSNNISVLAWFSVFFLTAQIASLFGCKNTKPDPCEDRQCGFWSGENCGACSDTDYCNADGLCVGACTDRQCGTWHGVDCGACPACRTCDAQGACIPDPTTPPPDCPGSPGSEICINGWSRYLAYPSDNRLFLTSLTADPDAPEDATRLAVGVYDLLAFTLNPQTTDPLATAEVNPRCGTFRALNVQVPSQGLVMLVADDIDNDATDTFAFAGVPYEILQGQNLTEVEAAAITNAQAAAWTASIGTTNLDAAGCGAGDDLTGCGTWIGVYRKGRPNEPSDPVEGVIPQDTLGDLAPEKTFYPGIDAAGQLVFDHPAAGVVWSDDQGPHEWTGMLGTVFAPAINAGNLTGLCGGNTPCEAGSCIWLTGVGGTIPGVLTVQFMWPVSCNEP